MARSKKLLSYAMEDEQPPSKHSQSWNLGEFSPDVKSEDCFNSELMSMAHQPAKQLIFIHPREAASPIFNLNEYLP